MMRKEKENFKFEKLYRQRVKLTKIIRKLTAQDG